MNSIPLVAAQPTPKVKNFAKANSAKFFATAEALGWPWPKLAKTLGYKENAHSDWKKSGLMPYVAALACDALLAKNGVLQQGKSFLVKCPSKETSDALQSFSKALNLEILDLTF